MTANPIDYIKDTLDNAIFPGDDGEIEHVDLSYKQFMRLLDELYKLAWTQSKER